MTCKIMANEKIRGMEVIRPCKKFKDLSWYDKIRFIKDEIVDSIKGILSIIELQF